MQVVNKREDQRPFATGNLRTLLSILKIPYLQESQEHVYFLALLLYIVIPLTKAFFTFLKKPMMVMAILSKN